MGENSKAQAVVSQQHSGLGRGASICPCSSAEKGVKSDLPSKVEPGSRPEEQPPTKRMVASSNLVGGTTLDSPVRGANHSRGLTSGRSPKAGLVPTVTLSLQPEESKAQSDLPQLQNRDRESWTRTEQCPTLEMPTANDSLNRARRHLGPMCGSRKRPCAESFTASWKAIAFAEQRGYATWRSEPS